MSNKEIQQLFLEQFKSNKNNSGQNKFPLCFSRLNCEQITLIIKELQSIGHKVTFIVDLQNSMNESKAIKQSDFSVGIINYSNKFNYSYNYFDALIKCLEDGSGLVKLIIAIKEFGIGMKLTLIRSLTLTSSQASALLLPFLLSLTSDIPPIILPIHSKYHHHSLPIIYFNLILAGPFLGFSSLFNYWNTLYSTNIYLEPNNDVKEFFSPFSFNSTISSTVLKQQYNLKEASTIWLLTLLISQHLHIFICIIFSNGVYWNVMKR
uniref:Glucuronosyltransferase n=1 Tax=Meloidogyne hapla TaxID=6305 RepID=A0A1I8BA73_MELHA